jgi:hypothetical protein
MNVNGVIGGGGAIELMVRINGLSGTVFRAGLPKLQMGPLKFEAGLPGLDVGSMVCHFDFLLMCNTLYTS